MAENQSFRPGTPRFRREILTEYLPGFEQYLAGTNSSSHDGAELTDAKRLARLCPGVIDVKKLHRAFNKWGINDRAVNDARRAIVEAARTEISTLDYIFIGHGHSPAWVSLKTYIADDLRLKWEEYNRDAAAGYSVTQRLQDMLERASFAFLVMTAEDERGGIVNQARLNVIHEVGLRPSGVC